MGYIGITHLHVRHHRLGKRQQQQAGTQYRKLLRHLQWLHKIIVRSQHQSVKHHIRNRTDHMPVAADTKKRSHDQLGIQHTELRRIIPVRRRNDPMLSCKNPGEDHLRRHIRIQPVILTDDI